MESVHPGRMPDPRPFPDRPDTLDATAIPRIHDSSPAWVELARSSFQITHPLARPHGAQTGPATSWTAPVRRRFDDGLERAIGCGPPRGATHPSEVATQRRQATEGLVSQPLRLGVLSEAGVSLASRSQAPPMRTVHARNQPARELARCLRENAPASAGQLQGGMFGPQHPGRETGNGELRPGGWGGAAWVDAAGGSGSG